MKRFLTFVLAVGLALPILAQTSSPSADKVVEACTNYLRPEDVNVLSAALSFDKQAIYISVIVAPKTDADLYVVRRQKEGWGKPELLKELSSDLPELMPTISSDQHIIYFVREEADPSKKGKTRTDIYFSELQPDGSWQTPQILVVSNGTDTDPRILNDDKTLIFTSIRDQEKKAQPKRYYITKHSKYNWTLPAELGEMSEKNLCSPYLTLQGNVSDKLTKKALEAKIDVYDALTKRLLASYPTASDGSFQLALQAGSIYKVDAYREGYSHENMMIDCSDKMPSVKGWRPALSNQLTLKLYTYDQETMQPLTPVLEIFDGESGKKADVKIEQSKRIKGTYHLMNLPIGKDYLLHLSNEAHADTVFHVDTRKDVLLTESELDILMRAGKVNLTLQILDAETNQPISGSLSLQPQIEGEVADSATFDNGRWSKLLSCATTYHLALSCPGYFFTDTLLTMPVREGELTFVMMQKPLRQAEVVQLKNVQFEYGSYLLREDSYDQLRIVADLMRQNPTLRVEISAHTDDRGTDAFNKNLSQKRGNEVTRYLIDSEGIAPDRIHTVGYGKDRPLVPNDSDEHRAMNRRVEFQIIEL